jgi:hypothetical protein
LLGQHDTDGEAFLFAMFIQFQEIADPCRFSVRHNCLLCGLRSFDFIHLLISASSCSQTQWRLEESHIIGPTGTPVQSGFTVSLIFVSFEAFSESQTSVSDEILLSRSIVAPRCSLRQLALPFLKIRLLLQQH